MSRQDLPPRQLQVLELIEELSKEHGYPPSLAELAEALGLRNRMTVHQHVSALKKKGLVQWEQGLNRSLRVIDSPATEAPLLKKAAKQASNSGIPFAGTIAAGSPIDAIQTEDRLSIEGQFMDNGCFALKVKGDSMIEDGIYDGDFVIIKPNPAPANGEIVVALLEDGSATLKRFYKEKSGFRLQPANSSMEAIMVNSKEDLNIQGTVVGLFRKI
jgi:repressor LexA